MRPPASPTSASLPRLRPSTFTSRRLLTELILDPPARTGDLAGEPALDDDYLILSTIHSAKGGEWRSVHVIHAADGNIPSDMALRDRDGLDEERRLLYVALTRARTICMSRCRSGSITNDSREVRSIPTHSRAGSSIRRWTSSSRSLRRLQTSMPRLVDRRTARIPSQTCLKTYGSDRTGFPRPRRPIGALGAIASAAVNAGFRIREGSLNTGSSGERRRRRGRMDEKARDRCGCRSAPQRAHFLANARVARSSLG